MSGIELDNKIFDHLLYLRVFEGCNLHCEHCYIPSNPKRMTIKQIEQVPELMLEHVAPGSKVHVQWHGGEPTALGREYLETALEALERKSEGVFELSHGIQTNLMTFDESWVDFYREYFRGEVGVSWDYAIRLMKKGYPETSGEFESRFWKNIDLLVSSGLRPYLVATATKVFFERFKNPIEFFELMLSHGVRNVHLERITRVGYARENWSRLGLSNMEYSYSMGRFAKFYRMSKKSMGGESINLSPFDGLFESVEGLSSGVTGRGYGCWSGKCDSNFHTIDANGYKPGCTAINSEYDNRYFEKRGGEAVIQFCDIKKKREEREALCGSCRFKSICNTGCIAVDKMDKSGECSGGYHLFVEAENALKM